MPKAARDDGVPIPKRLRAVPGLTETRKDLAEIKRVREIVGGWGRHRRPERAEHNLELGDLLHQQGDDVPRPGDGQVGNVPGVVALSVREGGQEPPKGVKGASPDRVFAAIASVGLDGQSDEQDEGFGEMRRAVCSKRCSAVYHHSLVGFNSQTDQ